jgi:putative ABC transport system permease protein
MLRGLVQDTRHALRSYAARPFTAISIVLTLALGMSAVAAAFSVVNAALLAPLPFADPDRLAIVWEDGARRGSDPSAPASAPNVDDWRTATDVVEELAIARNVTAMVSGKDANISPLAHRVSSNYFRVLGAAPLLGRTFAPGEDTAPAQVAVLSYGLWQRVFGGDPNVVGTRVVIDDTAYEVIGVMQAGFYTLNSFPTQPQLWLPVSRASLGPDRAARRLVAIARLKPGITVPQANDRLNQIAAGLAERYPDTNRDWGVSVRPVREHFAGDLRRPLFYLSVSAAIVLALAGFNTMSLLLAHATRRLSEFGVRIALGASSARICGAVIAECLLLTGIAGTLGLWVASLAAPRLASLVPERLAQPFVGKIGLDWRVVAFTAIATVLTGVLSGAAVCAQIFKGRAATSLIIRSGRSTATTFQIRVQQGIVIIAVALSVGLVLSASLLLVTYRNRERLPAGLRPDNLVVMHTALRGTGLDSPEQRTAVLRDLLTEIRGVPGILAASAGTWVAPLDDGGDVDVRLPGDVDTRRSASDTGVIRIMPQYFETLAVPLVAGRQIDARDTANGAPVVVVNRAAARRWFGQTEPLEKTLLIGADRRETRVVGVVENVIGTGADPSSRPAIYLPYVQSPTADVVFALRVQTGQQHDLVKSVQRVVFERARRVPLYKVRPVTDVLAESRWVSTFVAAVLAFFASVSVCLFAAGVYALASFIVAARQREMAIRVAMGATGADVARLFATQIAGLALVGWCAGSLLFALVHTLLTNVLFGVSAFDPRTHAAALIAVFAVVVIAGCKPVVSAVLASPWPLLGCE